MTTDPIPAQPAADAQPTAMPLLRSPRLWGGLIIGFAVGALAGGGAAAAIAGAKPAAAAATPAASGPARSATRYPVEIGAVDARPADRRIATTGSVEAFETVRVAARVGGVVDRVLVAEGDVVASGQPIAEIESRRYRLVLDSAEAAHAAAASRLADAEATLRRLQGAGTSVREEELTSARERAAQARADLLAAAASRDKAALDLEDATVRAPIPGAIQSREVQTGAAVAAGAPVATLVRRDPLQVRAFVQVAEAERLAPGQAIQIRPAGGRPPVDATIHLVAAAADRQSRQVAVVARLPEGVALRPGSFVGVEIPIPAAGPDLLVPDLAIRPSERGFLLYRVRTDGTAVDELRVEIVGRTADGMTAIRGPVQAGDRIVIRGAEALGDGVLIDVTGGPASAPATAGPA